MALRNGRKIRSGMNLTEQMIEICKQRLALLEDFYWELSGTDGFDNMTKLWEIHPMAAQLSSDWWAQDYLLAQVKYREALNTLDKATYEEFDQAYKNFITTVKGAKA